MPSHTKKERAKRVSRKIRTLKREGKPQRQAVAIALNTGRRRKRGKKR